MIIIFFISRFSVSNARDNCLLSDLDMRSVNTLSDLTIDSDWDVFRQFEDLSCSNGGGSGGGGGNGGKL